MLTELVSATVKAVPIYVCQCGARVAGSTMRWEVSANTLADLAALITYQQATSTHMPVGWSFNGIFKCERCTKHVKPDLEMP